MATMVAGSTSPLSMAAASGAVSLGPAVASRSTRARRAISSRLASVAAVPFAAAAQDDGGDKRQRDHQERHAGGDGAQGVEYRRGDVGSHAIDLERQGVEGAGRIEAPRKLVVAQGEAEQADADQAGQQDRHD